MPSLFWKKSGVVHEQPLQLTANTIPAFHVQMDGEIFHADLEPGIPDSNSLAFRHNGITYRFKPVVEETSEPIVADIEVGSYNQSNLFTMIKSYLTDGVTRSTTTGISLRIYDGITLVNQYRNVSQWRWATSSGGGDVIYPRNGEYNMGAGWKSFNTAPEHTANFFNNSSRSVTLDTAMTFV